ncbi:vascular endothelial growth factor A isoform X1 [Nycticebus coucang]|uniref:vascular endothelial growth factor A isoform X1 n=1 Tax=Nycticebus coucang TaxID=9470 RepID=UPI00234C8F82|nr:vascular endothelial growth factor A isoform X1 [Nycticebus coucang]
MNFLLSWVHWSLALLLYLHHAKWSQAAPMTEGEQDSNVMKFMDVYQRSYCHPMETLVNIFQEYPDEIEFLFKPSCVPLMRCSGCCNDESLQCVATEESNVTMQIMRIKPHQGQHIGEMSFLQHHKCECRPKEDKDKQETKSVRGKGKGQKRKRKKSRPCEPCSERRRHLFIQDPQTCKCSCKNTDSRCKARQLELNERTCSMLEGKGSLVPGPATTNQLERDEASSQGQEVGMGNGDVPSPAQGPRPLLLHSLGSLGSPDVTSQDGELGERKEPPSGFQEPDVSPGKTDTE